jgi:L-asparaginase/Glu-tRNA(Gln) amidotransferase subunit D
MSLAVLYTGGTIGGSRVGRGAVARARSALDFGRLARGGLPAGAPPFTVRGALGKLSENLEPGDWGVLAREVDVLVRGGATGIVLAHGTDTLIFTACALRWLLPGLPIPVAVTGSRLPLSEPGTDAVRNLELALVVAGQSRRPGVWVVFSGLPGAAGRVLDPLDARKEAGRWDCFQPVWGRPAGRVAAGSNRVTWQRPAAKAEAYAPRFEVDPRPVLFMMHPGFRPDWIRQAARRGVRGIVLAGYGSGTACAEGPFDLRPAVKESVGRGVPVWMVSQHGGRVEAAYGSTVGLVKAGLRLMPGCTPEAALTALMCGAAV